MKAQKMNDAPNQDRFFFLIFLCEATHSTHFIGGVILMVRKCLLF